MFYVYWRKQTGNGWGYLWPNGWNPQSRNSPKTPNPNIHQVETRWNLWQQTIRPRILFQILSNKITNTLQVSRLRTHHFVQIQFIQTSPNQHLYEENMPMLKGFKTPYGTFHSKGFPVHLFSIIIIFIENIVMLKSNPNPKISNRQPIPACRGYKVDIFNRNILC